MLGAVLYHKSVLIIMKKRPAYFILILLLVFIGIELFYWYVPRTSEATALFMGTETRIKVNGPGASYWVRRGLSEIRRLERLFNRFDPKSEVGLLNQLAGRAPLQLSPDTKACLAVAAKMKQLSGGAFDVRWNGEIDLGGIGKGYAVEAARRLLVNKGVKSAIIDLRSSIAVIGGGWRIGIRHPRDKEKLLGVIILHDGQSLSTSGDYERGKHIIDPRSGRPAELCEAVTVIGRDAAETDALSTAVFVLGPVRGLALIKTLPATEALVVDAHGKIYLSSGFRMEKP
jgi:FAD:protein FMN transferase